MSDEEKAKRNWKWWKYSFFKSRKCVITFNVKEFK